MIRYLECALRKRYSRRNIDGSKESNMKDIVEGALIVARISGNRDRYLNIRGRVVAVPISHSLGYLLRRCG